MTIAVMTHRSKNVSNGKIDSASSGWNVGPTASRDSSRRSLVADVTEFRLENTFRYEQVAQWLW